MSKLTKRGMLEKELSKTYKKENKKPLFEQIKEKINNKDSDIAFYTPSKLKAKYKEYDAKFDIMEAILCYTLCLAFAIICAVIFSLQWQFIIVACFFAIFFSPIILICRIKEKNEHKRFEDVNSYMQQFSSGMVLHRRVVDALRNTSYTFIHGEMHQTLEYMKSYIKNSVENGINIRKAEKIALLYMENKYQNTQIGMLHDFALRIETRGGEFEEELDLLTQKRNKWKNRVETFQSNMKTTILSGVILYIALIAICAFVQKSVPADMSIINTTMSQITETIMIGVFYVYIIMLLKHKYRGWLQSEDVITKKEADFMLDYVENFDPKQNSKISIKLGFVSFWVVLIFSIILRNVGFAVIGGIITVALFNIHNLILFYFNAKIKSEMKRAIPKWLFDVCLLMQKNNITVSITESVRTAPVILQRDILRFLNKLKKDPSSVVPYLTFLEKYELPNVRSVMRMLISINEGQMSDSRIQMRQLIEYNVNMLNDIDEAEMEIYSSTTTRYEFYPMIPACLVSGGYCIDIILKVFSIMGNMI